MSAVIKIWPRLKWRHVFFTFQLFMIHQSSHPKFMLYPTFSRSSPLWGSLYSEDFSSKPSSSSNGSALIFSDSYTALLSSTFIMCNTPQCEQLWIVADFLARNPNKLAPVIAAIITSQHVQIVQLRECRPYPSASMPTAQSSINKPFPLMKKGILIGIQIQILF